MRAPRAMLTVGVATVALAIAGCGGGDDTTGSGGGPYGGSAGATDTTASSGGGAAYGGGGGGAATTPAAGAALVSVADNAELGQILVNSKGFTLYDFHKDEGGKSACYGACAQVWSPLTGTPKAEKGAKASLLGTAKRTDGSVQVTYAGHPLYTYAGDSKPGQANGNDISQFGGEWYALTPSGEEPKD
jgi:predicted lipoprotein with Yx(FWY)xxD motif